MSTQPSGSMRQAMSLTANTATTEITQPSRLQAWINAYNADTHIPSNHAKSNQAENFAEHVILAVYDNVVPGGLAGIPSPTPSRQAVQNQYNNVKSFFGNKVRNVAGARCARQPAPLIGITSPIVCMGPAARDSGACEGFTAFKRSENGPDALIAAAEKLQCMYEYDEDWAHAEGNSTETA